MTEEDKKEEAKEEAVAETKVETKAEEEKPIDKMTAKELREVAKEIPGVTGVHAMKKEELLAVVKEAKGITGEAPQKKKRVKAAKKAYTVKELRTKVIQLKEEKAKAREEGDRAKIAVLRRRINRMKKLTRKVAQA
jgi:cell division protein FtsX